MQDNEFDDLFSKKLNDLEMEPSANVWAGIDAELSTGQRNRKLMSILSIAASVVILITAGVLFIPRKGQVDNTKQGKNRVAHNAVIKPLKPRVVTTINTSAVKSVGSTSLAQVNNVAVVHKYRKMNMQVDKAVKVVPVNNTTEQVKASNEQSLTAVVPQKADNIKPVVPDLSTPLMAKTITADPVPDISSKPVLATATPDDQAEPAVKKHRVRNIGDLVNLVVDKVDKRKNKIIVFSDTDGDESMVTALNVGPIKINKDNK